MKYIGMRASVFLGSFLITAAVVAQEPFGVAGFRPDTKIIEAPVPDGGCSQVHDCNWDGTVENGYCWQGNGCQPPDYGAWAECFDNEFVCEAEFYFTQTGNFTGQTMDLYVWEDDEGLPGNVICSMMGLSPGLVAFWPSCSVHRFDINCQTGGSHFLGFWGDWPFEDCGWHICADEDGYPGCPVTKFAPGIGYPTGWGPLNLIPIWLGTLGICEWTISDEVGACCFGEECVELTGSECVAEGGLWSPGSCDPNPCVGACCIDVDCIVTTEEDCVAQGGEWDGSPDCDGDPCTPIGACCLGDDCVQTTEADCLFQGGEWFEAVPCDPNPCTLATGVVLAVHGNTGCVETNGDPCSAISLPATCEELSPEACPDASGMEWYLVVAAGVGELSFSNVSLGIGGYDPATSYIAYYGPCYTDLLPLEVPSARWPAPKSGTFVSWAPNCLEGELVPVYYFGIYAYGAGGAIPLGDYSSSEPAAIGSCDDLPVEEPVSGFGVIGSGDSDGFQVCPGGLLIGACCFPDGSCQILSQDECSSTGGLFIGGPCDGDCPQPPMGACCFDFIECQMMGPGDCEEFGGVYQGDGTTCADDPCPPLGACCLEDQECVLRTEEFCADIGGSWEGSPSCSPNPCPPSGLPEGSGGEGSQGAPRVVAYPNPSFGMVTIELRGQIGQPGRSLRVVDVAGRLVRSLGPVTEQGTLRWDGRDQHGREVASGVYRVVLSYPDRRARTSGRLLILR